MFYSSVWFARRAGSPERSIEVHIRAQPSPIVVHLAGGPEGTVVTPGGGPADAVLEAEPMDLLGFASGLVSPAAAVAEGRARAEGDLAALEHFPEFFEMDLGSPNPEGT